MAREYSYSDNEMTRLQQDAMTRVRNMQNRTQLSTSEGENISSTPYWRSNRNSNQTQNSRNATENTQPIDYEKPEQDLHNAGGNYQEAQKEKNTAQKEEHSTKPEEEEKKDTTLIQDVLDAIGLDDDRILILGLLFILINAKADTTLVLALIYLLI